MAPSHSLILTFFIILQPFTNTNYALAARHLSYSLKNFPFFKPTSPQDISSLPKPKLPPLPPNLIPSPPAQLLPPPSPPQHTAAAPTSPLLPPPPEIAPAMSPLPHKPTSSLSPSPLPASPKHKRKAPSPHKRSSLPPVLPPVLPPISSRFPKSKTPPKLAASPPLPEHLAPAPTDIPACGSIVLSPSVASPESDFDTAKATGLFRRIWN